jgi:hypothetical protein
MMRGRLDDMEMGHYNHEAWKLKAQRYALAIGGDEIAWKIVEGNGKSSRLELTPWPASMLLCCLETV